MDNQTEEGLKQMTDMVSKIYQNFLEKDIEPIIACNMAIGLAHTILSTASKSQEQTISDIWGIYGGKAD